MNDQRTLLKTREAAMTFVPFARVRTLAGIASSMRQLRSSSSLRSSPSRSPVPPLTRIVPPAPGRQS